MLHHQGPNTARAQPSMPPYFQQGRTLASCNNPELVGGVRLFLSTDPPGLGPVETLMTHQPLGRQAQSLTNNEPITAPPRRTDTQRCPKPWIWGRPHSPNGPVFGLCQTHGWWTLHAEKPPLDHPDGVNAA
jgi:hypothetical protein